MNWVGISHRRLPNLGDQLCRPELYFDLPLESSVDWLRGEIPKANYLIGGGGAIHGRLAKLAAHPTRTVVWGTGWVYRRFDLLKRPAGIELYGSRDWGQDDADFWAPCVSCMHEAFDETYEVEREVVGFWNPDFDKPRIDIPSISNRDSSHNVFSWLGSAETVVTNSYHGAYWATLLGKKVIIVNAYSGKFTHFEPSMQPPVVADTEWRAAKPTVAEGALEMCREANRRFYEKVRVCL